MFFFPYKCRCEAIGGNRRRGERYKCLNGGWMKISSEPSVFTRSFDLPAVWKGLLVYLHANSEKELSVCINGHSSKFCGEKDVTEFLKAGENSITVEPGRGLSEDESGMLLRGLCLTARPAKHIEKVEASCERTGEGSLVCIKAELGGRLDLGGMPKITAEIYDEELDVVASGETDFIKDERGCVAEISLELEKAFAVQVERPYQYTLLLLCAGETVRRSLIIDSCEEKGCLLGEPLREECQGEELENSGEELFKPITDLKLQLLDGRKGVVTVKNISGGEIGGDAVRYKIYNQRGLYSEGTADLGEMAPEGLSVLNFNYEIPEISPFEYFLNVEYQGCTEQFKLPVRQTVCEKSYSDDMPQIFCEERDREILSVKGENFLYEFDLTRGVFKKISMDGVEFTAEDGVGNIGPVSCKLLAAGRKCVAISGSGKNDNGEFSVMWIIFGNGEISVSVSAMKVNDALGITVKPHEAFINMQFFGEVLCGGSLFAGIYKKENFNVEQRFEYDNIRWTLFKDGMGRGLLIKGVEPFKGGKISNNDFCFRGTGDIGAFAASFSVRPVFVEDEDIVREARTLPAVAIAKNDEK